MPSDPFVSLCNCTAELNIFRAIRQAVKKLLTKLKKNRQDKWFYHSDVKQSLKDNGIQEEISIGKIKRVLRDMQKDKKIAYNRRQGRFHSKCTDNLRARATRTGIGRCVSILRLSHQQTLKTDQTSK